jgi:plasmid stability protein
MMFGMTLTLRDIPFEVDAALRRRAEEQHRPVDQVAVEVMKAGLGLAKADSNTSTNLAESIRTRFGSLGGIELAEPIRDPMPEPLDLGK